MTNYSFTGCAKCDAAHYSICLCGVAPADNRWYLTRRVSPSREVRSPGIYTDKAHADRDCAVMNQAGGSYCVQGYRVRDDDAPIFDIAARALADRLRSL